jgi:hypothetical protein
MLTTIKTVARITQTLTICTDNARYLHYKVRLATTEDLAKAEAKAERGRQATKEREEKKALEAAILKPLEGLAGAHIQDTGCTAGGDKELSVFIPRSKVAAVVQAIADALKN